MGGLCCCCDPRPGEIEEYTLHTRDDHHWFCPRCCMRCFFRIHAALCGSRMHGSDASSSVQNVSSSALLPLEASPEACHAPSVDTRYHRAQTDASNSRIEEKIGIISHSQVTSTDSSGSASAQGDEEGNERRAKAFRSSDSPVTSNSVEALDDDACPTCLEEYVQENPKIIAHCGHHFHLGCIYDWLERSPQCPICDKEMVFNEDS